MKIKRTTELNPNGIQKSFWGRAHLLELENGATALKSYDTIVAVQMPTGEIKRTWGGWSATTGKHLRAAFGINKAAWDKMPVEDVDGVVNAPVCKATFVNPFSGYEYGGLFADEEAAYDFTRGRANAVLVDVEYI